MSMAICRAIHTGAVCWSNRLLWWTCTTDDDTAHATYLDLHDGFHLDRLCPRTIVPAQLGNPVATIASEHLVV